MIHASPTLFHAGTCQPQLSSCFLLAMKEDSIAGIYDTLKQVGGAGLARPPGRRRYAHGDNSGGIPCRSRRGRPVLFVR